MAERRAPAANPREEEAGADDEEPAVDEATGAAEDADEEGEVDDVLPPLTDTEGTRTAGVLTREEGPAPTDGTDIDGVFTGGADTGGMLTDGVVTDGVVATGVDTDGTVSEGTFAAGTPSAPAEVLIRASTSEAAAARITSATQLRRATPDERWTMAERRVVRDDMWLLPAFGSAGHGGWQQSPFTRNPALSNDPCRLATVRSVRIATWNVNSIKQRLPRLLPWLDERQPDVVCLQETKLVDAALVELLGEEVERRGYALAAHGEAAWNGVAILSRAGLEDVVRGLPGGPGFPHPEARAISATCGGVRVVSVYVPNGREPDSDHYRYKLAWLGALRDMIQGGSGPTVVCGDMNIAPADEDVFDPEAYVGQTHVTAPERAALAELQSLGLRDVVRDHWPQERVFTYWDYRAGMFHQDLGMRIDLILASEELAGRVQAAWVDRQARKGRGPSDHAPVIVDLDEAPDGNIGPIVPPPSAPARGKRGSVRLPQSP